MNVLALKVRLKTYTPLLFLTLFLAAYSPAVGHAADVGAEVRSLTLAHTRLVWVQAPGTSRLRPNRLVGLDSEDGAGVHTIVGHLRSCEKPLLTSDGKRVVFSNRSDSGVYVVNWNGTRLHRLITGYATDVWVDPVGGAQWVYARAGAGKMESAIWRYQLDHPEKRELVWNKTPLDSIDYPWFQVSADGTHAGAAFPWPRCSAAVLPNQCFQMYGEGCWPSMAPDNSYRLFHLDGAHKRIIMYDDGGGNRRTIPLNDAPGIDGRTIFYPHWTRDARFITMTGPSFDAQADFYIGRFNPQFTAVEKWVRITHNHYPDRWGDAWIDPGVGHYTGKAPFTVNFKARAGDGVWTWAYGDGATESAHAPTHTYVQPGRYTVTASAGSRTVSGTVEVLTPSPPHVLSVHIIDDMSLSVTFTQRVQLKDARISLEGLGAVKSWTLDPEGRDLLVELPRPLASDDYLLLDGIYDRSQEPEKLSDERVSVHRSLWPSSRSNLQLLWESNKEPALHLEQGRKIAEPFLLDRGGLARLDRDGIMSLNGGSFCSEDSGYHYWLADAIRNSQQFSVEATIHPASLQEGTASAPALILYFGWRFSEKGDAGPVDQNNRNFWLGQQGKTLLFSLKTNARRPLRPTQGIPIATLPENGPAHIVISYRPGRLTCYLNGQKTLETSAIKGALNWVPTMLTFGRDAGDIGMPWRGKIEGFALYSRAIDAAEATRNYAAYETKLEARKPIPQTEVEARLVARSPVPQPAAIAPYHNALVVYEYEVTKVLKGSYNRDKIRVAHWGLLDKQPTSIGEAKIGSEYHLLLEDFKDHPELEPEFLDDTLPQDFELPLYVDAGG